MQEKKNNNNIKNKWDIFVLLPSYLATCSRTGILFHVSSSPLTCSGGNEKTLTVELPLRISFKTRSADIVLFIYKLFTYSISASSLGIMSSPSFLLEAEVEGSWSHPSSPSAASDEVGGSGGSSLIGKRPSSIDSHSFTSLKSKSVVKKGCCKTFWMKGKRMRAPVLLSYFFSIFTNPVERAC